MRRLFVVAGALLCLFTACQKKNSAAPAIPRDADIEARVEKVLRGMSLEEKAGQMVQLTIMTVEDDTHEALDPAKLETILPNEPKITSGKIVARSSDRVLVAA